MTNTSTTALKFAINPPKYYNKFANIHDILVRISHPYIFLITSIGLITNTSTIILLSKSSITKNLRHKWTLIALAISDLILNIVLLIRVIHDIFNGKIEYLCLMISFLSHLAELLSACFIVLFTAQRCIAVRYPLQVATQKRSSPFIYLPLIFISSLAFCIILLHSNTYDDCQEELKLSWFIADALFSFIIPFSLILIFNILIINSIRKHARSPITIQSTLLRPYKRIKNDVDYKKNENNYIKRNISRNRSFSNTSQGTLSEIDIERKLPSSYSLIKIDENDTLINSDGQDLSSKILNEISISLVPNEKGNSDELTNHHSRCSSNKSTKSCRENTKENHLNSFELRSLSHLSSDSDSISRKIGQTTQSIRVTRMLILVSTCFLILNAPAHLCTIIYKIYTTIDSPIQHEHTEIDKFREAKNLTNNQFKNLVFIHRNNNLIHESNHTLSYETDFIDDQIAIHIIFISVLLTQFISYASYSINFFLYSFSGISFRTNLRQLLKQLSIY